MDEINDQVRVRVTQDQIPSHEPVLDPVRKGRQPFEDERRQRGERSPGR